MRKTKAFTLIEMLIVIVIIGILAAALIPRLREVQGRARDTKRKVDLRTIANTLEIYMLDNASYPSASWCSSSLCRSILPQTRIPPLSWIISTLPVDPRNEGSNGFNTGNYIYTYAYVFDSPKHTYDLFTALENLNDPERCAIQKYKYYNELTEFCVAVFPWRDQIYDVWPR